ncbi:hypothetical protein CRYUN_Cryun27aG0022000 [Craigia yunnanensis]
MNKPAHEDDEQGEIFLDESDIIHEVDVDEEDIPDADDEDDTENIEEEPDDSIHIHRSYRVSLEKLACVTTSKLVCELYVVACSPTDPALVASGGGDDKGFLWKIGLADWASELQGMAILIQSLAFSSDGQLLASGSFDGLVKIWDTSGNLKRTLEGPGGGIEWVKWHPKGHLILAGSEDCTVWMWNADNGHCLNVFSGHGATVTCGDFTPDGKTICTGSEDATLRIWYPRSGESIHVVRRIHLESNLKCPY